MRSVDVAEADSIRFRRQGLEKPIQLFSGVCSNRGPIGHDAKVLYTCYQATSSVPSTVRAIPPYSQEFRRASMHGTQEGLKSPC
jgi:hypothetical protein